MKKLSKKQSRIPETRISKTVEQKPWHKNPALIISAISVLSSTIVGALAILNSWHIARLQREFYTPILEYQMGQGVAGKIYLDILNQGNISAKNLTATLDWNSKILLNDCQTHSPYQDMKPVQPLLQNSLTYHLNTLPIRGRLRIECSIFIFVDLYYLSMPPFLSPSRTPSSAELFATPTLWILNATSIPTPTNDDSRNWVDPIPTGMTVKGIPFESLANSRVAEEIVVSKELIEVFIVAENAEPAFESAPRPKVIAIELIRATPTPSPLSH